MLQYGVDVSGFCAEDNSEVLSCIKKIFLFPWKDAGYCNKLIQDVLNNPAVDIPALTAVLEESIMRYKKFIAQNSQQDLFPTTEFNRLQKRLEDWHSQIGLLTNNDITEFMSEYSLDEFFCKQFKERIRLSAIGTPEAIRKKLDEFVIGQEVAKTGLSIAFYLHMIRTGVLQPADFDDSNSDIDFQSLPNPMIMLIGPTGSGKTFSVTTLCDLFKVTYVKVDCASLVASGYVGTNLNEALLMLTRKAGSNEEAAKGVIIFDEFDKLSELHYSRSQGSVGGVELQQEFLSLIESEERKLISRKYHEDDPGILETSNILFVFTGSFNGIEHIIKRRLGQKGIGYKSNNHSEPFAEENVLKFVQPEDIEEFGIIPELVGRISYFVGLDKLTADQLVAILKQSEKSILKHYQYYFSLHGDSLKITDDALGLIAEKSLEMGGGARMLRMVLQTLLSPLMAQSPDNNSKNYVIDRDYFESFFNNKTNKPK